jgi:hypothetical protein
MSQNNEQDRGWDIFRNIVALAQGAEEHAKAKRIGQWAEMQYGLLSGRKPS